MFETEARIATEKLEIFASLPRSVTDENLNRN